MRIDPGGAHPGYALGTSEPFVQRALVELLNPGDVFYDLGANIGFFTLLAARLVGSTGTVIAFEPDPRNAEALRANIAVNGLTNVTVVERGVSDTVGVRRFAIAESTASHLADATADEETTVVDVISLDSFASDVTHRAPTVMKIDIEGEEVHALRGAEQLLATHRPVIICEVHGTKPDVCRVLQHAGYRLRTLEDREHGSWNVHILAVPG